MTFRGYPFDIATLMKDAGAITSTAAATVGGNAKVLDLRKARFEGTLVLEVSALDLADTNETYAVEWQLSNASDFGSGVVTGISIPVTATGTIEQPILNVKNGVVYQYARLRTVCGGTSPSINYTGHIALKY